MCSYWLVIGYQTSPCLLSRFHHINIWWTEVSSERFVFTSLFFFSSGVVYELSGTCLWSKENCTTIFLKIQTRIETPWFGSNNGKTPTWGDFCVNPEGLKSESVIHAHSPNPNARGALGRTVLTIKGHLVLCLQGIWSSIEPMMSDCRGCLCSMFI